jgi:hypothetical protein
LRVGLTAGFGVEHASQGVARRHNGDAADCGAKQVAEMAAVARDQQVDLSRDGCGQDRGVIGGKAMSRCPRNAAMTVVASSGRDVPTATMVRPITISGTPKPLAIRVAPSTSHPAPTTRRATPTITRATFRTWCRSPWA